MGFETHSDLFVEEAFDLLRDIESPLMELEAHPERTDLIGTIFRAMHTIKGSAGMFGFDDIARFTHDIETAFDAVRKGTLPVTSEIIELTLSAKDCIKEMLSGNNSEEEKEKRGMILSMLAQITGSKSDSVQSVSASVPVKEEGQAAAYHIVFKPDRNIFLRGVRIQPLLADLDALGQIITKVSVSEIPCLEDFDPEQCYLSWECDLLTSRPIEDIRSVFIFVEDYAKIEILKIEGTGLAASGSMEPVKETAGGKSSDSSALKIPQSIERRRVDTNSIRVKNEKLDMLVNLVGEMVTLHARLSQ